MGLEAVDRRQAIADYLKRITPPYPQPTTKFGRAQVMNRLARLAVW